MKTGIPTAFSQTQTDLEEVVTCFFRIHVQQNTYTVHTHTHTSTNTYTAEYDCAWVSENRRKFFLMPTTLMVSEKTQWHYFWKGNPSLCWKTFCSTCSKKAHSNSLTHSLTRCSQYLEILRDPQQIKKCPTLYGT